MRSRNMAATAALILVCAAGCSTTPTTPSTSAAAGAGPEATVPAANQAPAVECTPSTASAGKVLRGSASYDYDPFESISEAVAKVDVAVSGRIISWSAGRSIIDGDDATRFAVAEISVDDSFAGDIGRTIYVSVDLGSEGLDAEGKPVPDGDGSSTVLTLDEVSAAAPAGIGVLFLGAQNPSPKEEAYGDDVRVVDARAGLPDGATLYAAYPQGFLLEGCDGSVSSALADDEDIDPWVATAAAESKADEITSTRSEDSFELLLEAAGTSGR